MKFEQLSQYIEEIGDTLQSNGQGADDCDKISHENYTLLKEAKLFSAMVPEEFSGGGVSFSEMSQLLRKIAHYHPSTALSCSMHQHIIAANRYNHINGRPGQALLEKVAANELVLVSTGAGDWLASNGDMTRVDGGYTLSGAKHFASGSPEGNVLVTSAPYEHPSEGWQVLHFPVPLNSEGVTVLGNWSAMGMRGTGSNSVELKNVFIPEESIAARRPRGDYHMMWSVILPVALPLIMSVYTGIAESAAMRVKTKLKTSSTIDPSATSTIGEMENALTTATVILESMLNITNNFNYQAEFSTVNEIVKRKTILAKSCQHTVQKAMEAIGGQGYLRPSGIESLFRDVMAGHFHPMPEKRQLEFTGHMALDLAPPGQLF